MADTYNPADVIVSWGTYIITGFADGTFISVTPSADRFSKTVGADGRVARAKSNDNTHEVTMTLLQTSPANDLISTAFNLDRTLATGQLPLSITDLSGTSLFFWPNAWIRQEATTEYSKEIGERSWVFDTDNVATINIGGNS